MPFALFQQEPEPLPVASVARALALIPRLAGADAARVAGSAHGVLLDGLSEEEADAALPALVEHGVQRGDQAWLEPLAGVTTRRLRLESSALLVLDAHGGETVLAWTDVLLLACAELPDDRASSAAASERPVDLVAAVLGKIEPTTRTQVVLELVVKSPVRRYRIEASGFDYTCLGALKQPAAARNFRLLLQQIAQHALAARHNQGAAALLAQGNPRRYADQAELDRETAFWLWKLHAGDLARCERAPRSGVLSAELDPASLLPAPSLPFTRARGGLQLARTLAPLLALVIIGWLLYLLNRLSTTGFDAPP